MKCPNCDNDPGMGLPAGVGGKAALRGEFKCGHCDTILQRVVSKRARLTGAVFIVLYLLVEGIYLFLQGFYETYLLNPVFILAFGGVLFLLGASFLVFFIKDLSCRSVE